MGQLEQARRYSEAGPSQAAAATGSALYKADRPRPIDQYISYFGERGAGFRPEADPCGEGFLESLEDGGGRS